MKPTTFTLGLLSLFVLCLLAAGAPAEAQTCQPGYWQDCLALEQQCVQCGWSCVDADSGPCWEAEACYSGYYVYDRWQVHKGVNCQSTGVNVCYLFHTYTEFEVDYVRHETWERRECYDGSSSIFTTMAGYSTTDPGTAWLKAGYCALDIEDPEPKINECI